MFGPFEVSLKTGELRKHGLRVKLQEQPFQVLVMLLERRGEVIRREEFRSRLWPQESPTDFDHRLNAAVRRLRDALSDAADNPRYIETLPRRGYRFISEVKPASPVMLTQDAPVEVAPARTEAEGGPVPAVEDAPAVPETRPTAWPARRSHEGHSHSPSWQGFVRKWWHAAVAAGMLVLILVAVLARRPAPPASAAVDAVQIAVLPFSNETKDPEIDYLSAGVADMLAGNLAQIGEARVTPPGSSAEYQRLHPAAIDAVEAGQRLHAAALVTGSFRRNGDAIHASVELLETHGGKRLWHEEWVIPTSNLNSLQQALVEKIARNLNLRLSGPASLKVSERSTGSARAFDLYLRGRYAMASREVPSLLEAADNFQRAVDIDPNYVPALVAMADAHSLLAYYGGEKPLLAYRQESAAIKKAIDLAPDLADAHVTSAYAESHSRDFETAEREIRRAVNLDANFARAHDALSDLCLRQGRLDDAIHEAQQARDLDPLSPAAGYRLAWTLRAARKLDEAEVTANNLPSGMRESVMAAIREAQGRYDEAYTLYSKLSGEANLLAGARALAAAGKRSEAQHIVEARIAARGKQYASSFEIAEVYAALGEHDQAIKWLNTAWQEGDGPLWYLRTSAAFDRYRNDPEVQRIQRWLVTPDEQLPPSERVR